MRRAKILYVIATMDIGGAERQLVELVKRLNKDKYDVTVCCLTRGGPLEEDLKEAGIKYCILWKRFKFDFSVILKLIRLLRREKADILHTYMFTSNSFGRVAGILARVPEIIISEHCVDIWKNRFHFFIDKILLHWTDKVICVSNGVRKFYVNRIGISEGKTVTIYNGIALGHLHTNAEVTANKYGLCSEGRIIGAIGRLIVQKGLKYLIHAMAITLKQVPQTKLLIIGDGPERGNLCELAGRLGITDKVIFLGFQKDITRFLRTMEILAMPSLFEGLPVVALEAMTLEKPVIATKILGVDEVVEDGKTGVLVPPRNPDALAHAIIELLNDVEESKRMGMAGRERVEKYFNVNLMVKKYEDVYDELSQKL
ncbi:GT4 family glycosyltransferase PelF [bacterium]|nr:GT4 family glycosyltransferase PelF [bacterium]